MKFLRYIQTIESLYFDIQWNVQLNITKWVKSILTWLCLVVRKRYFVSNIGLYYIVIYQIRKSKRSFKHRWRRKRKKRSVRKKRMTLIVKWRRKKKIGAHRRSVEEIEVGIAIETGIIIKKKCSYQKAWLYVMLFILHYFIQKQKEQIAWST